MSLYSPELNTVCSMARIAASISDPPRGAAPKWGVDSSIDGGTLDAKP
jgi:hypothetical protein